MIWPSLPSLTHPLVPHISIAPTFHSLCIEPGQQSIDMEEQGKQDEDGVDDVQERCLWSGTSMALGRIPHDDVLSCARTFCRQFRTTSAGDLIARSASRESYQ
jgi:hypothetical protein